MPWRSGAGRSRRFLGTQPTMASWPSCWARAGRQNKSRHAAANMRVRDAMGDNSENRAVGFTARFYRGRGDESNFREALEFEAYGELHFALTAAGAGGCGGLPERAGGSG